MGVVVSTEAGKRLLAELEDMVEEAVADQEHFANWWVNECRIAVEEDLPDIEAEARAAERARVAEAVRGLLFYEWPGGAVRCILCLRWQYNHEHECPVAAILAILVPEEASDATN